MKKLYYLLVVVFVAMATNVSAQFVQSSNEQNTANTTTKSGGSNFFKQMSSADYNRFYVGYNPVKIKYEDHQSGWEEELPFKHGVTVGYLHASNLVKSIPLYLEYGANFMYSFGQEKYSEREYDYSYVCNASMYSVNVPVSLSLRLSFNNNKIAVTPYLGLNFRVNVAGNLKEEVEYDDETESFTTKLFDGSNDDEALGDYALKRFQAGFNIGVGLTLKSFYLGVGYVTDFSKIANYEDGEFVGKMGVTTLTLGIAF